MAPALANGHAPYSRTLSHISEASVDAALAEASVEASGLDSLVWGPNLPVHPDPTHGSILVLSLLPWTLAIPPQAPLSVQQTLSHPHT